jgi:hypothetical protein
MRRTTARLALAFLLLAGGLLAVSASADTTVDSPQRVVIIDDDGVEHVVSFDGAMLEVVTGDGDDVSVHAFDLAALEPLIDEAITTALAEVDLALASIDSESIDRALDAIREHLDGDLTIDLQGLDDLDATGWDRTAHDELERETRALREDMARLRAELDQLTERLRDER